jgi:hypothetical protein
MSSTSQAHKFAVVSLLLSRINHEGSHGPERRYGTVRRQGVARDAILGIGAVCEFRGRTIVQLRGVARTISSAVLKSRPMCLNNVPHPQ